MNNNTFLASSDASETLPAIQLSAEAQTTPTGWVGVEAAGGGYSIGDTVEADLPAGWKRGTITGLHRSFGIEVKYIIKGRDFETISSSRSIRKTGELL